MNERKDERWLDDQLRRAIDGDMPVFDAESWKRRHRREYEALLARGGRADRGRVRLPSGRWFLGLAAAAVILAAVGMLLVGRLARGPETPIVPTRTVAQSPAGMMSMKSLRMAYEQGGFDGLDRQLQSTLDEFGPRSSGVSLQELFLNL